MVIARTNTSGTRVQLEWCQGIELDSCLSLTENDAAIDGDLPIRIDGFNGQRNVPVRNETHYYRISVATGAFLPERLVFFFRRIAGGQKSILSEGDRVRILFHSNDREADLHDPIVEHLGNVQAAGFADTLPEVLGDRVAVNPFGKVDGSPLEESLLSNIVSDHAKDCTWRNVSKMMRVRVQFYPAHRNQLWSMIAHRRSLHISSMCQQRKGDLIWRGPAQGLTFDLIGVWNGDLDRVAGAGGVEVQSMSQFAVDEIAVEPPFGEHPVAHVLMSGCHGSYHIYVLTYR